MEVNNLKLSDKSIIQGVFWISLCMGILYIGLSVFIALDPLGLYSPATFDKVMNVDLTFMSTWKNIFAIISTLSIGLMAGLALYTYNRMKEIHFIQLLIVVTGVISGAFASLNWLYSNYVANSVHHFYADQLTPDNKGYLFVFLLDPEFLWTYGGLALFFFSLSIAGLKKKLFTRFINVWGLILAAFTLMITVSYKAAWLIDICGFKLKVLFIFSALTGGILAPVYCLRMAFFMKKELKK